MTAPVDSAERIGAALEHLRTADIRVHCITNSVAQAFTANVLLALGVTPSMTISPQEVGSFVESADALLINLGTMDADRRAAVDVALRAAHQAAVPWVLDPVLINRSEMRREAAVRLLRRHPRILRANALELGVLTTPEDDVATFSRTHGTTVALTGAQDLVTDGMRRFALGNGHPLMERVTAMGCAATAVVAAMIAVESDPLAAAVAGLTVINVAGEIAGESAKGPGSFSVGLLDALHGLEPLDLARRLDIVEQKAV